MSDLITTARARYNLNNLTTTADEDTTIAALVSACSRAVVSFCGRSFVSQDFDELYHGHRRPQLLLRQFPVLGVARVAFAPSTVLRIRNDSASSQRATVAVTSTGLRLTRVASGVVSTNTSVTWADYATLGAVATAVSALGNGWSAAVVDASLANRASADLRALQGALHALEVDAEIKLHLRELTSFALDADQGTLLLPNDHAVWFGGANYWRVFYTAGFSTVPEDVQEACAQWVAALFWKTKRDPGLAGETVPGSVARSPFHDVPADIRSLLFPYRQARIAQL